MARGPKKHLKRLRAPKSWMLAKLGGIWAPRPSEGPHKLRESIPLSILLKQRLHYALTRREVIMIMARRSIKVDAKVRSDINYPCGFQDIVSIDKTNETFRLLYDVKGRFLLHRIQPEEAGFKLAKIVKLDQAKKASQGRNPFLKGHLGVVPYAVTNDGRTIRYLDPSIGVNDTVKIRLSDGKVTEHVKFEIGNLATVMRGANVGRIGLISSWDVYDGKDDIIHLKDARGQEFATRIGYVFVIGKGSEPWISLPRGKGLKYSIIEEKERAKKEK